ncbi:hypothetical protein NECAME_12148 [Necator americanus]|uniref:Uncharacterized protein n=1 Tax=Necator americanus TaxID=51031 RepID=W2T3I0_NECAM|nr:hypothetical protein NECAME_12148 [Necator americanus]ETN75761.1 hypothetical protein NECAME_12148 [Necator americanus]
MFRTVRGSERSDPRMKSRRERKKSNVADLQGIPTTVVTLTNTQLLPADGDTLRMKTIRNRVEPMNDVAGDEDLVEIDIDAPPRVYISKILTRGELESPIISVVQLILPEVSEAPPTTEASKRKTFYSTHTLSTWKLTETPSSTSTTPAPITKILWVAEGVLTEEEKRLHEEIPVQKVHREKSTLEKLSNESPTTTIHLIKVTPERPRPRPVKHGFDRSLDKAIDAGLLTYPSLDSSHQKEYEDDGNFQFQLSTFSSSATCIARTMFDIWCVCQLMTLFPYLIGVCAARRSLFVSHLVLDILLLVIGFVYT